MTGPLPLLFLVFLISVAAWCTPVSSTTDGCGPFSLTSSGSSNQATTSVFDLVTTRACQEAAVPAKVVRECSRS